MEDVENEGKAWDRFMRRLRRRSPGTQKIYLDNINEFFDKIGMSAQEFYELRRFGWTADDPLDRDEVEDIVSDYLKYLKVERRLASGSVWNQIKPITLFLKAVKMPLDMEEIDAPRKIYNGQRKVRSAQILVMYDNVGTEFKERNRAVLMMAKDMGFRVSDLSKMDLEQVETARRVENDEGEPFLEFQPFKTKKTGDLAHPRVGPEAVKELEAWLKARGGEPGPLFTKRGGGRIGRKGLSALFLRRAAHLEDSYKISGHSFRKFHKTACEAGGVHEQWIRRLQGKAHDEYSAPTEEELTKAYMEAYDELRVFENVGVKRETIEELQRTVMEQQRMIDEMTPTVRMAQRMLDERKEWDRLRGSPRGP